jgi:hypothetical protein
MPKSLPKSGCNGLADPMVVTHAAELAFTCNVSIGVFQALCGGNCGQPKSFADALVDARRAVETARAARDLERTMEVAFFGVIPGGQQEACHGLARAGAG